LATCDRAPIRVTLPDIYDVYIIATGAAISARRSTRAKPTIKEVAQLAGVALSSVSRVLNDHPDVSENMRSRVLEAIAELGYEPNLLAAGLRRGSSRTIGFIVPDLRNPLFGSIVTAAQDVLSRLAYAAVITTSSSDADRDADMARLLRHRQVDALIVSLADQTREDLIEELRRFRGPIVLLDREVDGLPDASIVETDHGSGMGKATRHLLSLGHERVALLTGSLHVRPSAQRVQAFREAYRESGLTCPEDLVRPIGFSPEYGERSTIDVLRMPSPPTALIVGGNQILAGVLRSLRSLSIRPGIDIALISCDDVPLSQFHNPPITVIDRDVTEIGNSAARLALEHLEDPGQPPRRIVLPTTLVLRDSTNPPN